MIVSGYKITYKHYRIPVGWKYEPVHYRRGKTKWMPESRGGKTECFLYMNDRLIARGETICSEDDNFEYSAGRYWAFENALTRVGGPSVQEIYREMWRNMEGTGFLWDTTPR